MKGEAGRLWDAYRPFAGSSFISALRCAQVHSPRLGPYPYVYALLPVFRSGGTAVTAVQCVDQPCYTPPPGSGPSRLTGSALATGGVLVSSLGLPDRQLGEALQGRVIRRRPSETARCERTRTYKPAKG